MQAKKTTNGIQVGRRFLKFLIRSSFLVTLMGVGILLFLILHSQQNKLPYEAIADLFFKHLKANEFYKAGLLLTSDSTNQMDVQSLKRQWLNFSASQEPVQSWKLMDRQFVNRPGGAKDTLLIYQLKNNEGSLGTVTLRFTPVLTFGNSYISNVRFHKKSNALP